MKKIQEELKVAQYKVQIYGEERKKAQAEEKRNFDKVLSLDDKLKQSLNQNKQLKEQIKRLQDLLDQYQKLNVLQVTHDLEKS